MKLINKALSLIIALVLGFGLTGNTLSAEAINTRTLAMVNKPGVVLVQTVWTANITWYEIAFYEEFHQDVANKIDELVQSGAIENTEQAQYRAMVQLMTENMQYYAFKTGNAQQERASAAGVGTGFIVTPDGYMVTNAHVVETDEQQLYLRFARSALEDYAVQSTDAFEAEMRRFGYQMSQEEWDNLANAYYSLLAKTMDISNLQTTYYGYIGNVTPGSDVSAKGILLDVRKVGESAPGKDIAILKMDKTNLPTVTLGDDTALRTGDQVYAMGYPALATLTDALNVNQAIQEPTMTQGIISAKKEMPGGWDILQTDADIHGGNSGGPLFNDAGEVVGVNTFSLNDPSTGASASGMNFAIPISVAKQFLNELNVTPSESDFTKKFKEAKAHFDNENYTEALTLLRNINETNPGYPVVADLLAQSASLEAAKPPATDPEPAITSEEGNLLASNPPVGEPAVNNPVVNEPTPVAGFFSSSNAVLLIVAGIGVLLLVAVVILLLTRRKKPLQANAGEDVSQTVNRHLYTSSTVPRESTGSDTHASGAHTSGEHASGVHASGEHASGAYTTGTQASPGQSSFCSECGTPLAPGTKYCSNCGAEQKV